MKTCTVCKTEKDLSEFGKQKSSSTGIRSACKKCHTEKAKLYAAKNKPKVAAYHALHYERNKEKYIERNRARYLKSSKVINKKNAEWKKINSDLVKVYNQNRKAKKRMQVGQISRGIVKKLMTLQGGHCINCKTNLHDSGHHLDHIMPIDLGGLHTDENLQLLCPKCNLRKFNKDPIAWAKENGRLL